MPTPTFRTARKRIGGTLKLGVPLREDLSLQLRYSLFSQKITLPSFLNDCQNINPDFVNTFPTPERHYLSYRAGAAMAGLQRHRHWLLCLGQASLPIRLELAERGFPDSLAGYGLTYNTLDNNKHPTGGMLLSFGQDFAGLGGDVAYMRTVADFRAYYEVVSGPGRHGAFAGRHMLGLNGAAGADARRFQDGPNLVRGFQPAGIGPRDLTPGTTGDALGGTLYWGASVELQYPSSSCRRIPASAARCSSIPVRCGTTRAKPRTRQREKSTAPYRRDRLCGRNNLHMRELCPAVRRHAAVRASVGASLIWDSPFGPLRFDFAYPLLKQSYDRLQWFQFGGGARF